MKQSHSNIKWYALIALALIMVSLGTSQFINNVEQIKTKTQISVDNRTDLFRQYINFMSVLSDSLKLNIESHLHVKNDTYLHDSILNKIRFFPEYGIYSLKQDEASKVAGTLHILKDVDLNQTEILSEIESSLSLDSLLAPLTNKLQSTAWAYYASKNSFLYITPKHNLNEFQFNKMQYKKPFWTQAIPENNPEHRMVITDIYKDGAGKGMMITISNPVITNGEFKGVVSIDISIKQMNNLLGVDPHIKSSMLVDENHIITASKKPELLATKLDLPSYNLGWTNLEQSFVYITPVLEKELYIVHKITKSQLWIQAIKESLFQWSLLAFGFILSIFSIQLFCISQHNKKLMMVDPLTQLYNRRGFEKLAQKLIAHSRREHSNGSVLLLDIDFFKQVNDQFGHNSGDQILVELSKILKTNNREDSIISRWGGEEFLILLADSDVSASMEVANRLHSKIRQTKLASKTNKNAIMKFTVSIGIAPLDSNETLEDAINHADKALYQAKQNGRNSTTIYQA